MEKQIVYNGLYTTLSHEAISPISALQSIQGALYRAEIRDNFSPLTYLLVEWMHDMDSNHNTRILFFLLAS